MERDLWTFAEFARKIGKSRSWVTQLADLKLVEIVEVKGGRLIKFKGNPTAEHFNLKEKK